MSPERQFPPYISYLIVTIMSVALLAMQTTIPFKLAELGRGFDAVGFLFTWVSLWYVISGLALGKLSHHLGPRRTMLTTLLICAALTLCIIWTNAVWQLYVLLTGYFIVICLFWSAAEHASTGMHLHLTIVQSTSIYCVAFSVGDGLGMLVSTYLQGQTLIIPFIVAAGLTLVVFALTWITVSPQAGVHRATPRDIADFTEGQRARLRRSLIAARIGLVGTYGAFALVMLFLPRYLWEQFSYSKPLAGSLTSLGLVAMATSFATHGLWTKWPHKLLPVRIAPFLAVVGLLIVVLSTHPVPIAIGAMISGGAAGIAYMHNLYYALEEPGQRAQRAGIHESLVGVAFLVPPALSGLATLWTSKPQTIFWAGIAFALFIGVVQNSVLAITASSEQTSAPRN
jgi:MFS family permease